MIVRNKRRHSCVTQPRLNVTPRRQVCVWLCKQKTMSAVRLMTSTRGCLDNVHIIVHIPLTYPSQISPGCDVAHCDPHATRAGFGQTDGTVLMCYQEGRGTTRSCSMNNYRSAAAFYLLSLNAEVEQFPAQVEKTKDFQCIIALLHY